MIRFLTDGIVAHYHESALRIPDFHFNITLNSTGYSCRFSVDSFLWATIL